MTLHRLTHNCHHWQVIFAVFLPSLNGRFLSFAQELPIGAFPNTSTPTLSERTVMVFRAQFCPDQSRVRSYLFEKLLSNSTRNKAISRRCIITLDEYYDLRTLAPSSHQGALALITSRQFLLWHHIDQTRTSTIS